MDVKCESPVTAFDLAIANALRLNEVRKLRDESGEDCRLSVVLSVDLDAWSRMIGHVNAVLLEFGWARAASDEWHYESGGTLYTIRVARECYYAPYGEQNGGVAVVEFCYSMEDIHEGVPF